jgi:protein gp37
MGCEGCELWNANVKKCYAGWLHVRRGGHTTGFSPTFEELTRWPGRLAEAAGWPDLTGSSREDKPWLNGLPRLIFLSDMSDALSKAVPFDYLEEEIIRNVTTEKGQRHLWLWLTKRPDRMTEFSAALSTKRIDWPTNLWVGTSITTQKTTVRIDRLLSVGNANTVRFVSVEPQWEAIDLSQTLPKLDWIIQGGESNQGGKKDAVPFHAEWALRLANQCKEHQVPYFLKQLGSVVYFGERQVGFKDHHGGDWSEWPELLRVRQMPSRHT